MKPEDATALSTIIAERVLPVDTGRNEIRAMAKRIITDPAYVLNLQKRAIDGRLSPAVEVYLLQIGGGGKPAEEVKKVEHDHAVKIVHAYTDEKPKKVIEAEVVDDR